MPLLYGAGRSVTQATQEKQLERKRGLFQDKSTALGRIPRRTHRFPLKTSAREKINLLFYLSTSGISQFSGLFLNVSQQCAQSQSKHAASLT